MDGASLTCRTGKSDGRWKSTPVRTEMDQLSRQMAANPAANLLCLDVAASWMVERGMSCSLHLAELQSVRTVVLPSLVKTTPHGACSEDMRCSFRETTQRRSDMSTGRSTW